ncbi:hypothetical protein LOAG_07862 [Loa loa]|uniref:Uncharacterized protein n=1 Tax=Loa loa TaxID=7209 RepID=A0A1S0TVD8_LOALO|nr:hypothetical protein LOAG_07862 [Loa loa]EFO20626.1 hypothetical protein LOAG_07862 [Loa loa]
MHRKNAVITTSFPTPHGKLIHLYSETNIFSRSYKMYRRERLKERMMQELRSRMTFLCMKRFQLEVKGSRNFGSFFGNEFNNRSMKKTRGAIAGGVTNFLEPKIKFRQN